MVNTICNLVEQIVSGTSRLIRPMANATSRLIRPKYTEKILPLKVNFSLERITTSYKQFAVGFSVSF